MTTLQRLIDLFRSLCDRLAFAPPLLARVVIGVVFTHSGLGKWQHLDGVTKFFASLGIPYPEFQAPFVASVELGCGALVLLGLGTRLAAIPLIGTMVVALATALAPKITGLNALFGLAEFLYIALLVQLIVGGAGALSLDRWLVNRFASPKGDGAAAAGRGATPARVPA
jgi:putative oxidoreductase